MKRTLLKNIKIFDQSSSFHLANSNILIAEGKVVYLGPDEKEADDIIEEEGLCLSAGWVDMNCWFGDPGFEHKEDLFSVANAAAKGGFTEIVSLPTVQPVVQTKNAIAYIQSRTAHLPITFLPAGAVSVDTLGKDLTEMIDLHQAGAVAFTDGEEGIQGADLLLKALHYVQFFDGLVIQRPQHAGLSQHGQMHEGIASTRLGLKGIPALAEEVVVSRDLQLLEYSGGKLHLSLLSTAGAINMVREAKVRGLAVTCDVASYQVAFTDEDILDFDTNYKVNPPFRSQADKEGIIQGLKDGTIDALVSAHKPQDTESKKLEFDLAEFGIINLETAFSVAITYSSLEVEDLITKFTVNPRKILGLPVPVLKEGELANFTLFNPLKKWVPLVQNSASKADNSPFFGLELTGQVYGIINKGQVVINPEYNL
ncbi:dihydroorotase [Adhaeribacter aquaticus]|uniref:dihydroorotase n=1 Tax=Adhaeribacter aquaticus TaxID=299567 RepID=UPI000421C46C|nr:dihydroorotase [Adhaeribacter aquaticus]